MNSKDIQCDPIEPGDIFEQVLDYEDCYFGHDAITREQLDRIRLSTRWTDMAYIVDGRVAAYAFLKTNNQLYCGSHSRALKIWMARLVIGHEFRKEGLARHLETAMCSGPYKYMCHIPESWISSQLAMKALGWKAVGITEAHYRNQVSYKFVKDNSHNLD